MKKHSGPKVLLIDIETAPILANVWSLWEQNVGINQIAKDWHILSWSAKWLKDGNGTVYGPHNRIMYEDQSRAKNVEDDKKILKTIRNLLDEADIIVSQNGRRFDEPKLNARFIVNKITQPSKFKHIDTCELARRKFAFTSNKLEYLSEHLKLKVTKLKDSRRRFPGFELWKECIAGNKMAWREMEKYNKQDVIVLEELYKRLAPWNDKQVNFNLYADDSTTIICSSCGGHKFKKKGFELLAGGKYQAYQCTNCGHRTRDKVNLLSTTRRKSLRVSS